MWLDFRKIMDKGLDMVPGRTITLTETENKTENSNYRNRKMNQTEFDQVITHFAMNSSPFMRRT